MCRLYVCMFKCGGILLFWYSFEDDFRDFEVNVKYRVNVWLFVMFMDFIEYSVRIRLVWCIIVRKFWFMYEWLVCWNFVMLYL